MWVVLTILLAAVGVTHSLPAPVSTLEYEPGISYKYNYLFTIFLNEDSNITSRSASVGRNVGYKVSSEFVVSNIWQSLSNPKEKLLMLELLKPALHVSSTMHSAEGINKHWSKLDNLSYPPIYIHWDDGLVKKVYILPDSLSMINMKKGLASLFQIRVSKTVGKELDVSGLCDVSYKTHATIIKKTKFNCQRRSTNNFDFSKNKFRTSSITTQSETVTTLIPHESVIETVTGREEVMMTLNLWKQAAVFVKTKLHVNFVEKFSNSKIIKANDVSSALASITSDMGSKFIESTLEAISEEVPCNGNCKSLYELVKEYGINLLHENLGKVKSATGFLKILDGFKRASRKELLILFKDTNERILPQLLDVLAAAQTEDSIEVAFQLIDFESKDTAIAERFLLCIATLPYPNEMLITRTLKLLGQKIKSEKLRATILVTISSMVKTYCQNEPHNINSMIVQSVSEILIQGLQKCNDAACILNHLLALRNAGISQHIPVLLDYIKQGGVIGLTALEALKDIGEDYFNEEVKNVLLRVYNQFWPHQESAARVLAAELLIKSDPTIQTIGSIIKSLSDQEYFEIHTLVLSKLYSLMQKSDVVRSSLKEVLHNITYGNYYYLAQNGSSTSYIDLLLATHDANISYGINMEMRPTGMLKRTSFDLSMLAQNGENPHLLSLGLFVEGFGLTEEEQKESPEEHAAGMQLSVLGVHLRPYIFFTGTSELMGLVWSGAGSEPTPALQANFLFMDQTHSVVLQNGISVDFNLKGALSADISGTVEVSMWNKNAHAKVVNSGALLVNGFCKVDTSFVESHVDFALGGSSTMDMYVDLDFAKKPMKICLQVEQPGFVFRHNVRKTETIPGSKHLIKTLKRRSLHFPGKSFNLHKKNSDSCRELLLPKPQSSSFW